MQGGFIAINRNKLLNWEWKAEPNVFCLFIHLLANANYEQKSWKGIDIQRGQFVTSISNLSVATGLTIKQIRTAMSKLESTQNVANKGTNKYTIVTICDYESWVCDDCQQGQAEGQTKGKQKANEGQQHNNYNKNNITIKENIKRKVFQKPDLNDCAEYATLQGWQWDVSTFYDYYESKGWLVGKSPMKDWRAAMRNWNKNENNRRQYGGNQDKQSERVSQFAENTWNFINKNKC